MGWQLFLAYRRTQPLSGGELALLAGRIALLAGAMLIAGLAPSSWLKIRRACEAGTGWQGWRCTFLTVVRRLICCMLAPCKP